MPARTDDDLQLAIAAAQAGAAAALAERHRGPVIQKSDASPVSRGDGAADRAIVACLQAARPSDGLLSEERDDDPDRLDRERVWIIDPIDGTRAYIGDGSDWAVQIALAVDGVLRLGVLAMPAFDRLVAGIVGKGAWQLVDGALRPWPLQRPAEHRAVASRRLRGQLRPRSPALAEMDLLHRSSVGVKVVLLIDGVADCYLHPQPIHEWDLAAPAAVLLAAGGRISTPAAVPLRFNQPRPRIAGFVCSTRPDHAAFVDRLGPSFW